MPSTRRRRPRSFRPVEPALVAALLLAAAAFGGCSRRADDPVLALLAGSLRRGDRVILTRALDPEATRVALVVDPLAGKPELRFYERKTQTGPYTLVHTAQEGDVFGNLDLEDVNGDGKDEIVSTWEGGHLEIVAVIALGDDNIYHTIFQNAGRQVERRYDDAGLTEFWITSRTYEEGPGQPPAYATSVYRWERGKYVEAPRK